MDHPASPVPPQFLFISGAAAQAGISASRLRQLEAEGRIPPAPRVAGTGYRVYTPAAVERIKAARATTPPPRGAP